MRDPNPGADRLVSLVDEAGGWGYTPGQAAHIEPTCLALLALSGDARCYQSAIQRGHQALVRFACPDGSYRLDRGREQAVWPTALALFVQCVYGEAAAKIQKTAAGLLAIRGKSADDPKAAELHDIDHRLVGWPWALGNFSWVEPTAWACLALKRAGYRDHPRVRAGLELLRDRIADTGGVNYGNKRIFGRLTEPQIEPTALLLLALQGEPADNRMRASVRYLVDYTDESDDLERLCWAKIALQLHAEDPHVSEFLPKLDEQIHSNYESRRQTAWLTPSSVREALTRLALNSDTKNIFRIPDDILLRVEPSESPPVEPVIPLRDRVRTAFRTFLLNGAGKLKPLAAQSVVHIAAAGDYQADLADVLCRQYESFRARVPLAGKRVVLKPNLVEYHRDRVINTHPHVVAAAIELCRRENAREVIVAEGPGHCRNVEHLVRASGLGDVLSHYRVPFVDLNHDEPAKTLNLGRLTGLDHLYVARTVATADVLISMPKLKTHHWAGATLSLKNLFGTLPGICYGWPKNELHWRGIDNSIVDIALSRTPDLAIVDGIMGMEGDGPLNGSPRHVGALIMGTDLVAVDASCCRLMQLDPQRIGYLVMAAQKRLGISLEAKIQQLGESIQSLAQPFETLPHLRELRLERSA